MRFGVIGVGAVGGYYGGLIARTGADIHFLLHSDYAYVKQHGLTIDSVHGNFHLDKVNAYSKPEDMPKCDVIIIALKATQNRELQKILPAVLKKDGVVILLQNGLGAEQEISRIAPHATIIGGLCFLCSNRIGPGHIRHLDYGAITLAQYAPHGKAGITHTLKTISDKLVQAGISIKLSQDLMKSRWEKLVWNIPFNGLTVILDATTEELIACQATQNLLREIMMEVIAGAGVCGYTIKKSFADEMIERTKEMVAYKPSMKLDFEQGRSLEINEIYWRPVQKAEAKGYHMAKTRAIALELDFLNKRNQKKQKI